MADNVALFSDAKANQIREDKARKKARLAEAKRRAESRPDDSRSLMDYGDALFDCGYLQEAEKVFSGILDANKDNVDLVFNLGFTFLKQGKGAEAAQQFKRVIALAPKSPLARSAEYELWHIDPSLKPRWVSKKS